jgi:hypothetical protein
MAGTWISQNRYISSHDDGEIHSEPSPYYAITLSSTQKLYDIVLVIPEYTDEQR